ncbi:hypothetical protein OSTOST_00745 [Ostertagia ostertagi]
MEISGRHAPPQLVTHIHIWRIWREELTKSKNLVDLLPEIRLEISRHEGLQVEKNKNGLDEDSKNVPSKMQLRNFWEYYNVYSTSSVVCTFDNMPVPLPATSCAITTCYDVSCED